MESSQVHDEGSSTNVTRSNWAKSSRCLAIYDNNSEDVCELHNGFVANMDLSVSEFVEFSLSASTKTFVSSTKSLPSLLMLNDGILASGNHRKIRASYK